MPTTIKVNLNSIENDSQKYNAYISIRDSIKHDTRKNTVIRSAYSKESGIAQFFNCDLQKSFKLIKELKSKYKVSKSFNSTIPEGAKNISNEWPERDDDWVIGYTQKLLGAKSIKASLSFGDTNVTVYEGCRSQKADYIEERVQKRISDQTVSVAPAHGTAANKNVFEVSLS